MNPYSPQRVALLETAVLPKGIRPAVDTSESARRLAGQTNDRVFSYNAHALHTWMCPSLMARGAMCHVLSSATILQGVLMVITALVISVVFGFVHSVTVPCEHIYLPDGINGSVSMGIVPLQECGQFFRETFVASMLQTMEQQVGGLTRFVLGGFVALALARTYYSNRSLLGTTFGSTLGACMMVASCLKPTQPEHAEEVRAIQELLVRWLNAAFRLMFLENAQLISTDGGFELLEGSRRTSGRTSHRCRRGALTFTSGRAPSS